MNLTTGQAVTIGIIALVIIAFFAVFRTKGWFKWKGLGAELEAKGENKPSQTPAAVIKDAKAERGNISATDKTGHGSLVQKAKTGTGDITATTTLETPPKA